MTMKGIIHFALLAVFAAVVLITVTGGQEWLIAAGFIVMFALIGVNYLLVYGIRTASLQSLLDRDEEIRFTAFGSRQLAPTESAGAAKSPSQRGRLVVTNKAVKFFVKKEDGSTYAVSEVFSLPVDQIEAVGLGPVLHADRGLILTASKHREARFAVFGMEKKFPEFKQALQG